MKILFVGKANVFRSIAAEYLMRNYLEKMNDESIKEVGSAGTTIEQEKINPVLESKLAQLGIDIKEHQKKQLEKKDFDEYDLVVAMSEHEKIFTKDIFYRDIPLFNEIAYNKRTSVFDIDDVLFNPKESPQDTQEHIKMTVDYLKEAIPHIIERSDQFKNYRSLQ